MGMSKDDILTAIAEMSVMEVVELIEAMEEKFGVTAAAAVAAAPAAAGGGDAGAAAEEQTEFDVVLTAAGEKKVNVIKVVRAADGPGPQGGQGRSSRALPRRSRKALPRTRPRTSRSSWKRRARLCRAQVTLMVAQRRSACGVQVGTSHRELLGQCRAGIRQLPAWRAGVRCRECHLRGATYAAAARAVAPGHLRQGGAGGQQGRQGRQGAGGLHGRYAADDRDRHLHHQRHRARHRLPAAPLAGRVLRPRQGQDAFVRQAAVLGAGDPLPRFLARFRVRSEGQRVRAHRPPPQAAGDHSAARARLQHRRHPRHVLRDRHLPSGARRLELDLVPERLRGETVNFEVMVGDEVLVESGRRVTRATSASCRRPASSAGGARRIPDRPHAGAPTVDTETGEVIAEANAEITEEVLALLREKGRRTASRRCSSTIWITVPTCPRPAHRPHQPSSRRRSRSIA
jgi:large subunit ribosomal protein L7/L12